MHQACGEVQAGDEAWDGVMLTVAVPPSAVYLVVFGQEATRTWTPPPVVQHVLEAEGKYREAVRQREQGNAEGALEALGEVIADYADCFWMQRALELKAEILAGERQDVEGADAALRALLDTPQGDLERIRIQRLRLEYGGDIPREQIEADIAACEQRLRQIGSGRQAP